MEVNKIHNINFLDNALPDKCANLIIADPPYFEVKGDFDFIWKSFNDYLQDVEKWAIECKRLLAENGTLFWYGHAKKIAYAQIIFDRYFNLENNIAIEFNRQTKKGVELFRCFAPVSERLLMYSLETPQTFISIRKYLWDEYIKTGLSMEQVNELIGTTSKGGGGMAYNTLSITRANWDMPKEYIYTALQKTGYFQKPYDELKNEYETLRRPFNNFKKLYDVMNFDQEAHITGKYDHDTVKPETLTRALIMTCSRVNDLVVVPFAGSGTECAMSVKDGRNFIAFEIEEKYVKMSNDRVQNILRQPSLFVGS